MKKGTLLSLSPEFLAGRDTLRAAMTRASEREGIPMIVALVDERGTMTTVADPAVRETGRAVASLMTKTRCELAPTMSDSDNGGVISALVIAAYNFTEMATFND